MKLHISGKHGNSPEFDTNVGTIHIPQLSSMVIKFSESPAVVRHDGQLVLHDGLIYLDYDASGYLVGIEIADCDPVSGDGNIDYMQPNNPLIN